MGIVVRPNKPIGGGGGPSWLPNSDLYATELDADIVALYTEVNGNLDSTNMKAAAGFPGTMFADNSIPTSKYLDLSLTEPKLGPNAVTWTKMKTTLFQMQRPATLPVNIGSNNFAEADTGIGATKRPISITVQHVDRNAGVGTCVITPIFDTTTNTWWIIVWNRSINIITIDPEEIINVYFLDV